jgi:hypothetical protein
MTYITPTFITFDQLSREQQKETLMTWIKASPYYHITGMSSLLKEEYRDNFLQASLNIDYSQDSDVLRYIDIFLEMYNKPYGKLSIVDKIVKNCYE